jgi:tetratricopeptide (TPR) repeat protein
LLSERASRDPIQPRKINPSIPRDLENIVLKASANSPAQRYQSGVDFADDLRRFIDDRPVIARAAGPIERLTRWCRRNRTVAVLSGAVIFSLLLALVAGWTGYVKTTDALSRESQRRIEADAAKRKAEENVQICLQAFEQVFRELEPDENQPGGPPPVDGPPGPQGPPPGPNGFGPDDRGPGPGPGPNDRGTKEAHDLAVLQSVLSFYNQFAEKNDTNATLQFEAAKAHGHVADVQLRLGENDKAEADCRKALAVALDFRGRDPKNNEYTLLAARSSGQMAAILQRRRQYNDAEKYGRQSLELFKALEQLHPDEIRAHIDVARARLALGNLFFRQQRHSDAAAVLKESIQQLKSISQPDNRVRGILGDHYRVLAAALNEMGDFDGSAKTLQEAKPFLNAQPKPNRPPPPPRPEFDRPPPPP